MRHHDAWSMVTKVFDKAPLCGAFLLISLILLSVSSSALEASDCTPCSGAYKKVERIVDGDTLVLRSGEKVRLIGINTPEIGRWGKPQQPGAQAAKNLLQQLISDSQGEIRVCPGAEKHDRYGRQLAHLSDRDGRNIAAQLLGKGMGWAIAVPPNLSRRDCYFDAESVARKEKLGVWRQTPVDANALQGKETGFHLIQGRVERIGKSRSALWLNLDGPLAIRITWKDWRNFGIEASEQLVGRSIEARGWLYQRKGEQRLRVRDPSSLSFID